MRRTTMLLAALLVATPLLAGCAAPKPRAPPEVIRAVADTRADRWRVGDHWEYHAEIGNQTVDLALIVHAARAQGGYTLGSNLSAGFFGLPWAGNVTRELDPELGDETWPMYRFPLSDGASWSYHVWGHDATTTARAAIIDVPGVGPRPGFTLEAASLGQVFAKYDYSPQAGWFTRFELIDPGKRETLLDVHLASFGEAYRGGYYVERVIAQKRIDAPALPLAPLVVDVPDGADRLHVQMQAQASAGVLDATLRGDAGEALLHVRATGPGADAAGAGMPGGAHAWHVDLVGAGQGYVLVEVLGVQWIEDFAPA